MNTGIGSSIQYSGSSACHPVCSVLSTSAESPASVYAYGSFS